MSLLISAKKVKKSLAIQNIVMIINFLDLSIAKLLEFNLVNKKFYNEIIPVMMLPMRKDKVPDWYKWNETKFDCSMRQRLVFFKH